MSVLVFGVPPQELPEVVEEDTVDDPIPPGSLQAYKDSVRAILDLENAYTKAVFSKAPAGELEDLEQQRLRLTYLESRQGESVMKGVRKMSMSDAPDLEVILREFVASQSLKTQKVRRFI
jgi:hypothetical protein